MKMNFKIGTMDIKELNIRTPEVAVELDFSLTEARGIYDLKKQIIKDLPEMLIDLKASADKFVELDKAFNEEHNKHDGFNADDIVFTKTEEEIARRYNSKDKAPDVSSKSRRDGRAFDIRVAKVNAINEVIEEFDKDFYYDEDNASGANGMIGDIKGFLHIMKDRFRNKK